MKYTFTILILFSLFFSCSDEDLTWNNSDIAYFECIWDKSPHNAFTDLIEYNNRYYCCFREGSAHVPSNENEYGKIRILESLDGIDWESAYLAENSDYDLRDPKLCITPDNRLMLSHGCSAITDNSLKFQKTMVQFASFNSASELTFEPAKDIIITDEGNPLRRWLWRIIWHKGIAYSIGYASPNTPILAQSADGVNFKVITKLTDLENTNESDIYFSENDEMTILIRSNSTNGYIGKAHYPYKELDWNILNQKLHCPKIISIAGELFASGRGISGNNTLYHIEDNETILKTVYVFPGDGDSSYPGMIATNNELWISYYTSTNHASIYLVKIPITKLLERVSKDK